MTHIAGLDIPAAPQVALPAYLAVLLLASLLAGRLVQWLARRWTGHALVPRLKAQPTPGLARPVSLATLAAGLLAAAPGLPLPGVMGRIASGALELVLVATCALVLSRLGVALVTDHAERNPSLSPALSVARVAVRVIVFIVAILTTMQLLGLPIAPILTTLGIGSLAVAFALQDTLANFFAGLYLLADRPVRSGDYIKMRDGDEGYVEAIGWRSTRLRTLHNNVVIVPNQRLSQAVLTNCSLPQPHLAVPVVVTVSYDVDAEDVEAALLDELHLSMGEIPELHGLAPSVRVTALLDSAVEFTCTVYVRDFAAQFQAAHQVRKRLLHRLAQEGIEIPFPQRVVHTAPAPERRRLPRPQSGPKLG